MHPSIERERQLLDEKRVKWNARRMEMITKEMKEGFQGEVRVEYRVDKQAIEKKLEETQYSDGRSREKVGRPRQQRLVSKNPQRMVSIIYQPTFEGPFFNIYFQTLEAMTYFHR